MVSAKRIKWFFRYRSCPSCIIVSHARTAGLFCSTNLKPRSPVHDDRLHSWTIWVQICSWRREKRWRHNWRIGHVCRCPLELSSWSWNCPLKVCSVWISGPTEELCNLRKSCPTWCRRIALWRAGKWWFNYPYNHKSTCLALKSKSRWLLNFRPPCDFLGGLEGWKTVGKFQQLKVLGASAES